MELNGSEGSKKGAELDIYDQLALRVIKGSMHLEEEERL